ncbi:NUDIX hydrolase [Arthrobacter sp. TPD3018]|uniref:NUDIX domain-containing protein n=1 Tax=Bacteria TaxID=2 RepID=UPI000D50D66D|nr:MULTISPECIES: NUDIX domain-containing protein [Bacteria]PVE55975.1 NUDIX hydrolase [Sphingomonas sp. TPD3009]PVE57718.1 NUDIX hydrolase [Arthrobacter sp. TPD3018]PVE83341.1 NUDIX hydrolase [Sphingomonas melonis]
MENVVALVGAMIFDGRSLLLGLRAPDRRSCPNTWDVIGGHVEAGESPLDALARELQEEVDIKPTRIGPSWTIPLHDPAEGYARLDLFVVDQWEGAIRRCGDEHVDLRWFDPREAAALPGLAVEDYRPIFRSLDKTAAWA